MNRFSLSFINRTTVVAIAAILLVLPVATAFAATSGPLSGSSFSSVAFSGSDHTWSNPNNAASSNGADATVTITSSSNVSGYLRATGFGFAIPSGATINGIQVSIERAQTSSGGDIRDSVVSLVKNNSVVGSNKALTSTNWPTSDASVSYGGTSDLWGTTWTRDDINNANFGVVLAVGRTTGGDDTASVDHITVTITYTVALTNQTITVTTEPPTSASYGNSFAVAAIGGASGNPVIISTDDGTCSINEAQTTITMTSATGDCQISFNQAGNASFNPAPEVTRIVTAEKATATIVVSGYSGIYDGLAHGASGSATGVLNENLDGLLNLGSSFTNVPGGTASWSFAGNANYNSDSGSVAIDISPRPITATADAASKLFGESDPALSYAVSGTLVAPDAFLGDIVREAGEDVGTYDILQGTLALPANYALTFIGNTFTILDEGAPTITLLGDASLTLNTGDTYTEAGATAADDVEGDISGSIVIGGTVDTNTPGIYTLTYNVADSSGNAAAEVTRTITVLDDDAPVISISYSTTALTNGPVTATAAANEAGTFTNEGGNSHVFLENGTFTFVFLDEAGNEGTAIATVANIDTAAVIPTCPEGFSLTGGDCVYSGSPVAPTCPEGYTQNESTCEPTAEPVAPSVCPEGYTLDGLNCVIPPTSPTCPEGLRFQEDVFAEGMDGCVSESPTAPTVCESGSVISEGECVVPFTPDEGNTCPIPGTVYRADIGMCVLESNPDVEPACADPLVMNGGECYEVSNVSCPVGTVYDDATDMCVQDGTMAATCPPGTNGPNGENLCVFITIDAEVCPAGYTLGETGCTGDTHAPTCPSGMHVNDAGDKCENDPTPPSSGSSSSSSSSGGGGGGGGGSSTTQTTVVARATTTPGQVLGATTGPKSCYQFPRYLARGMQGTDVLELQKILIAKGHMTVAANGNFGPATEAGVKAYQKANGLEQVGAVGPKTRALLNVCAGGTNSNAALIAELTKKLNELLEKIKALKAAQGIN